MTYIGIDVSKDSFVAAYPKKSGYSTKTFLNTTSGVRQFISSLPKDCHCVMEATGNYSMLLLYLLQQANITVSMENPQKIKHFARAMLSTTKTDEIDAKLIAMYGKKMEPAPYKIPSESIILLKQKRTVLRQLKKQLTAMINLQHSLSVLPKQDPTAKVATEQTIKFLRKQISKLEDEITNLSNKEFKHQMELLTSIKGIGKNIASALIMATGGFTYFSSAKQISRFLGLCPTYQQSGTSVNVKGHINRNGDTHLRSLLYVVAFASIRSNTACKETYERLRSRGKSGRVAIIAIANKLIRQAFAIVTNNRPYIDGYVSSLA
ncbi:MAG: IS110 family transposase [Paludibacteraceae bacterium]|nr:IS110 family transposase [Paludibacteraceae bacterium]